MKIPDGYIIVRKGGRPTKLDRDIGVLLMRHLLIDIRQEKALAVDPKVVEYFSLTDDSAMRNRIRIVKKKFGDEWQVIQVFEDAVMFARVVPVPTQVIGVAARQALKKVWLWAEGFTSALELSRAPERGMQPVNLEKWKGFKR